MTGRKQPERVEIHEPMEAAIQSVLNGERRTAHAATRTYGVSRSTLYERLRGRPSPRFGHEKTQLLRNAEEQELVG